MLVLILSFVFISISTINAGLPIPTGYGTVECKLWPAFNLQDYNPASDVTYLQLYGLADIQPWSPVTVIGMYFADQEECQAAAVLQEQIGNDLISEIENFTIHNVILNYYSPYECALTECETWWYNPFMFPWYNANTCRGYVGGCAPDDTRLNIENWQIQLSNVTTLPIFQDTYWEDAWERFGGGKGDIFIYDGTGRLFTFFCSDVSSKHLTSCMEYLDGGLTNTTTYERVKAAIVEASMSNSTDRCGAFEDDSFDYYYYYFDGEDDDDDDSLLHSSTEKIIPVFGDDYYDDDDDDDNRKDDEGDDKQHHNNDDDDEKSEKKDDDSDDKKENDNVATEDDPHGSSERPVDDDDDDDDDDDAFRFGDDAGRVHFQHQRTLALSSWYLGSVMALALGLVTGAIVYISWRRNRMHQQQQSADAAAEYPYRYSHSSPSKVSYSGSGLGGSTKFTRLPNRDLDIELRGSAGEENSAYGAL